MHQRIRRGLPVTLGALALAVTTLPSAIASTPPRLAGKFRTNLTITYAKNLFNVKVGDRAVRTWMFAPRCRSGACTTVLTRPSIARGTAAIYVYTLRAVSAKEYRGSTEPTLVPCFYANGQRLPKAYRNYQSMVLNVTRVAAGKVAAFSGTVHTVNAPTATGKIAGCRFQEQRARFRS